MTDSQKAGWVYAIEHAPRGIIRAIDRAVLAVWVHAEDQWRRAVETQNMLDKDNPAGMLSRVNGQVLPSPYLKIIDNAAARMMKAGSLLGFDPTSRPRLASGELPAPLPDPGDVRPEDATSLEQFLNLHPDRSVN